MRKEKSIGFDVGNAESAKSKPSLELTSLKQDEKEKASRTLLENEQEIAFEKSHIMRYLEAQSFAIFC